MKIKNVILIAAAGLAVGLSVGAGVGKRQASTAWDQGFTDGCRRAADNEPDNDELFAICIESERG